MNTVEQTSYKSSGQLPIIILLLILFAFKYYSSLDTPETTEVENSQSEVNGGATSGTQGLLIQLPTAIN